MSMKPPRLLLIFPLKTTALRKATTAELDRQRAELMRREGKAPRAVAAIPGRRPDLSGLRRLLNSLPA